MMRALLLAAALMAIAVAAHSAPPDGPVDPEIAPWFKRQVQPGTGWGCCDIADGRPVEMRVRDGHYEVLITRALFGASADDAWHVVPEAHIIRGQINPTGSPIAWWYGGAVRCFILPSQS